MTSKTTDEHTTLPISNQNYGSFKSMSKAQAAHAQTLEAPEATVQTEAHPWNLENIENVDSPLEDAVAPDWDDIENVDNPLNWLSWWKYGVIALVSLIELLTHLTSMLYAPGILAMQRDFNSHNNTLATFSMSIYVLGFSVGPLLFAPLSEVYGRVVIYRCCLAVFLCFTVACALSPSIDMLVGFRFVAGCFGAAPVAIGGAMVYDLFRIDERGVAMAIYHSGPIFGNMLGPPLGGLIIQHKSWRWVFWFITIFAGFALLCSLLILKETHTPTILHKLYLSQNTDVESDADGPTPAKPDPLLSCLER